VRRYSRRMALPPTSRTARLAGATALVGRELVRQLLAQAAHAQVHAGSRIFYHCVNGEMQAAVPAQMPGASRR
jgi:hypothetical protein